MEKTHVSGTEAKNVTFIAEMLMFIILRVIENGIWSLFLAVDARVILIGAIATDWSRLSKILLSNFYSLA